MKPHGQMAATSSVRSVSSHLGQTTADARSRRRLRSVVLAVAVAAGVVASWYLLEWVLANDRGLDITDEGLYLLAGDPPSLQAVWNVPWGWHTRPLFAAVGYDVSAFRTFGALILVAFGALVGLGAVEAATRTTGRGAAASPVATRLIAAVVGGTGVLLYYAAMLRTPSYNWINLAGILLFSASLLAWIALSERPDPRSVAMLAGTHASMSLGAFLALPAKPTTVFFLGAAGFVLALVMFGVRRALVWAGLVSGGIAVWMILAVVVQVWPSDFVSVFARAVEMPRIASQTVPGALRSSLDVPTDVASNLQQAPPAALALAMAGLLTLLVAAVTRRAWTLMRAVALAAVAMGALAVPGVELPGSVLTASLLVVTAATLSATGLPPPAGEDSTAARPWRAWIVVAYLCYLPFVFGFGSSNGTYRQASVAAGLLLTAAAMATVLAADPRWRLVGISIVVTFTLVLATGVLAEGRQHPYRVPPLSDQTTRTTVSGRDAELMLDQDLASVLTSLRAQADDAGWRTGAPLVGVAWRWSSTIPYALGARVPESLMLTLFGYPVSQERVLFSLSDAFGPFPFGDAWLLVSAEGSLATDEQAHVDRALATLAETTGREFPQDYVCAARAGAFELWKPASPAGREAAAGACDPDTAPSSYDARSGWSAP